MIALRSKTHREAEPADPWPLPGKAAVVPDISGRLLMTRCCRRRSNCSALRDFLLDDLVGAQQNRLRHRKSKRLGGLEVHDHLELGRKLHREIARLLAAQDAIHIGGGTQFRQSATMVFRSEPSVFIV